jgi:hypothetical protein
MTHKYQLLTSVFLFSPVFLTSTSAQIDENAKVYVEFENIEDEVNVNGRDACGMFEDYINKYTHLNVVRSKEESNITFVLSVYEKNMGNRRGKIDVYDSKSGELIYMTGWVKGMMLVFYGYSGTKHAIARAFIDHFLEEYPDLKKRS